MAAAAYPVPLRRWYLTWGATPDEVAAELPGDDLLPDPDLLSTRAIGIAAPPSSVWPWLVQMGSGRGGAYTYDWIEKLLGLDMHSVDEVLPQYQDLAVGRHGARLVGDGTPDAARHRAAGGTLRGRGERLTARRSDGWARQPPPPVQGGADDGEGDGRGHPAVAEALARAAAPVGYAPSVFHTQPWRWTVSADRLELG